MYLPYAVVRHSCTSFFNHGPLSSWGGCLRHARPSTNTCTSGINESYNSLVLWDEDGSETGSRACRLTATAREREAVVHKDDTDGK